MPVSKQQGILGALTVAASAVTASGVLWGFAEQVFAGEIKEQIEPVVQVQKILLESDIKSRRLTIASLEFKRDTCQPRPECWTIRDAQDLAAARDELRARESAMEALK